MTKVLIIGSRGTVGNVLMNGLPHDTTDFDLPEHNAEDYKHLYEAAKGHDTIVHLAWDFDRDGWLGESLNPDNTQVSFNVYQAAVDASVKRVIMISSVHADKFAGRDVATQGLLKPFDLPLPDSPYGASKCFMEALGRYYADAKGLEVVCIRLGGVNKTDTPPEQPYSERQVWLSHRDCTSLINACIEAPAVPYKYTILYGVSDNAVRLHDLENPFDWQPADGAR
jgi:nucleoside-diphosphate-sugar epimerase